MLVPIRNRTTNDWARIENHRYGQQLVRLAGPFLKQDDEGTRLATCTGDAVSTGPAFKAALIAGEWYEIQLVAQPEIKDYPMVGCLMPTLPCRQAWAALSRRWYREQTWPEDRRRLYVDADPHDPVSVKYNRLHRWAIEDGCEWLALWSDDDWQGPEAIEYRMSHVLRTDFRRVGYRHLHFCDLAGGFVYLADGDRQPRHWLMHLSMIIHRDVFLATRGYPEDLRVGSDSTFQKSELRKVPSLVIPPAHQLAFQHGQNTYQIRFDGDPWNAWRTVETLEDLIGRRNAESYRKVWHRDCFKAPPKP